MLSSNWSETLQQQTKEALENLQIGPDGRIHFKHKTLGYAIFGIEDMLRNEIVLRPKVGDTKYVFADSNELIAAGWAID